MGVGALKKGYLKNKSTGEVKSFLYNPEGFSDSRAVNFNEINTPGGSYPKYQYVNSGSRTFSLDLYLANTSKGSVSDFLNFLEGFLPKGSKFSKPPVMIFAMGTDVRECILVQLDRTFSEFNANLDKTKATVSLSLIQLG